MSDISFREKLVHLYQEKYEELKHVGSTFINFENKCGNILTIRKELVVEKEFEELIDIFNKGNYNKDIKIDLNKFRASYRFGYLILNTNDKIVITKGYVPSKCKIPKSSLRNVGLYFYKNFFEIDNSEIVKLIIKNKKNPEINISYYFASFNAIKMLLMFNNKNVYVDNFNFLLSINNIDNTRYNVHYDEQTNEIYGILKDDILNNIVISSLKYLKSCDNNLLTLVKKKVQDKNSELITKSSIITRKWYFKNMCLPELLNKHKKNFSDLKCDYTRPIKIAINILERIIKFSQSNNIKSELITKSSIITRKWYFKNMCLPELLNKSKNKFDDKEIYDHCLKYEKIIKLVNLLDLEEFVKLCEQDNINDEDISKFKYIYSMDKDIRNILIDF
ncbi:hypothetical protein Hokovirus_3_32 [Hokovirus HKV1]|uniref:Uncharacterized protein n=1 Tax=Hokovirus HKV1 TaxID=1977638 RepID=A0A1V0SGB2_9VIRU|nr:hypothetical protein Hokovirus_3_32 [Hokovirus HKV1]